VIKQGTGSFAAALLFLAAALALGGAIALLFGQVVRARENTHRAVPRAGE
jgi:hypothetical protein